MPRVTLAEVAARAGVSKATASLALRNQPEIREATRARVRAAAEVLGYRPDPALSVIAAHRWRTGPARSGSSLAFVVAYPRNLRAPYLQKRREGAVRRAAELGHSLEVLDLAEMPVRRVEGILQARGVRGVLLAQSRYVTETPALAWGKYAAVAVGFAHSRTQLHLVRDDSFFSFRRAWEAVLAAGYRRPGAVFLPEDGSENELRLVAVWSALRERLAAESREVPRLHWDYTRPEGLAVWVRRHRPDAVIGYDNRVLLALRAAGLAVPGDIGFASLDVGDRPGEVAGIDHLPGRTGEVAVEFLDLLIRRGEFGLPAERQVLLVGTRWLPGATLPDGGADVVSGRR